MSERSERRILIEWLRRALRERPGAGIMVGWVEVDPDGDGTNLTEFCMKDCGPLHLIVAAEQLLGRAGERVAMIARTDPTFREHLRRIERARADLDLYENKPEA